MRHKHYGKFLSLWLGSKYLGLKRQLSHSLQDGLAVLRASVTAVAADMNSNEMQEVFYK